MARLIAPIGVLMLLCACQDADRSAPESRPATTPAPGVVARFNGGEIHSEDVDARILRLPPSDRPAPGADLDAWYGDLIRGMVVDREMLEEARKTGLQDSREFRLRRMAIERQLAVQSCLSRRDPGLGGVTGEEIANAYEERQDQFRAPERRATFHLYLRRDSGESLEDLEAQMRTIRDRILRGERFQRLAQSESDSETRHREGSIGWVVRGQLSQALEDVIFALDEGVPSEPVIGSDGVHLFQVDDVLPERQLSLSEVRQTLRTQLEGEKVAAALDEVALLTEASTVSIVDRDRLEQMVEQGAEQEPVLTAEDYQLSLGEFRRRLGRVLGEDTLAHAGGVGGISNEQAWQFLERLQRHEAAYRYCVDEDLVAREVVMAQTDAWEQRAMVDMMRRQRLRERVLEQPDKLALYYRSNIGQFTPPVEWQLERLSIPFEHTEQARRVMARLEQAAASNEANLQALQEEVGGRIESLGWLNLQQMRAINTKLPQRVAPLTGDALVAPLRFNDALELYRTTGRREFEPRPFEEVREAVASAFLRQYTSEVYDELEAEILAKIDFELHSERLADLRRAGLSGPDVSVEQLDALLSDSQ